MSDFLGGIRKQVNRTIKESATDALEASVEKAFNTKRRAEARFRSIPGVKRALVSGYLYQGRFFSTVPVFGKQTSVSAPINEVTDLKVLAGA